MTIASTTPGPWDTMWLDVRLATMADNTYGIIEEGAIACRDGRIAFAGRAADLPGEPDALARRVIAGAGLWVTPGLIDCHTHLVHGGSRAAEFEQRLEGVSYAEIARAGGGILSTVRATREAGDAALTSSALTRLDDLLADGVTTVEIKSGYGLDLETELRCLRVARSLSTLRPVDVQTSYLGAHAVPPEYKDDPDAYLRLIRDEVLPAVAREGLADAVDAFCESIAFTPEQVARVFDRARELGLPVKLHAEQLERGEGARLAARYGALSADHLENMAPEDAPLLAASGTAAVLLPGAWYTLRETSLPPVEALRTAGAVIAVATDCNPGSSPLTSLLLAVNMACTAFRLTPAEALAAVTRNAAKALGLEDRGTLEPGRLADLAFWRIDHPRDLAYRIGARPLAGVVKRGEIVRALPG
ncbi:imidazolonepropionase [Marinivivus vitaminiproducens]|uniref:imidazolonepropionase n=1 Tax=Marinivivus vitaminiproducens TaxID=3035935 RepID=UPI0027A96E2E|nr:imidazolonepropionase [Geminicoccaceae bacterium SCSIO 64248]